MENLQRVLWLADQITKTEDPTIRRDAENQLNQLLYCHPSVAPIRYGAVSCLVELLQTYGGSKVESLEGYMLAKIAASTHGEFSPQDINALFDSRHECVRVFAVKVMTHMTLLAQDRRDLASNPIAAMICHGVVGRIAQFAVEDDKDRSIDLQNLSSYLLVVIAVSGMAGFEIKKAMLPIFSNLLYSWNNDVGSMAAWVFWQLPWKESMPLTATVSMKATANMVELLKRVDVTLGIKNIALQTLAKIATTGQARVRIMVRHGTIPILVKLLENPDDDTRSLATTVLGNLAAAGIRRRQKWKLAPPNGDDPLMVMIKAGAVPCLVKLVKSDRCLEVQEKAATVLGRIEVGSEGRVGVKHGVVPVLIESMKREDRGNLRRNAAWTLCKIASSGNAAAAIAVRHGAVPVLRKLLGSEDVCTRQLSKWLLKFVYTT